MIVNRSTRRHAVVSRPYIADCDEGRYPLELLLDPSRRNFLTNARATLNHANLTIHSHSHLRSDSDDSDRETPGHLYVTFTTDAELVVYDLNESSLVPLIFFDTAGGRCCTHTAQSVGPRSVLEEWEGHPPSPIGGESSSSASPSPPSQSSVSSESEPESGAGAGDGAVAGGDVSLGANRFVDRTLAYLLGFSTGDIVGHSTVHSVRIGPSEDGRRRDPVPVAAAGTDETKKGAEETESEPEPRVKIDMTRFNVKGKVEPTRVVDILFLNDCIFLSAHESGKLYLWNREFTKEVPMKLPKRLMKPKRRSPDEKDPRPEFAYLENDQVGADVNPLAMMYFPRAGDLNQLALSPNNTFVAIACADGFLRVLHYPMHALLVAFQSYYGAWTCCAWGKNNRYLLGGSEDDLVSIFDLRNRCLVGRGYGHHSFVRSVSFDVWATRRPPKETHPDTNVAAISDGDDEGEEESEGEGEVGEDEDDETALIEDTMRRIVSAGDDGKLIFWDVDLVEGGLMQTGDDAENEEEGEVISIMRSPSPVDGDDVEVASDQAEAEADGVQSPEAVTATGPGPELAPEDVVEVLEECVSCPHIDALRRDEAMTFEPTSEYLTRNGPLRDVCLFEDGIATISNNYAIHLFARPGRELVSRIAVEDESDEEEEIRRNRLGEYVRVKKQKPLKVAKTSISVGDGRKPKRRAAPAARPRHRRSRSGGWQSAGGPDRPRRGWFSSLFSFPGW